MTAPTTRRTIVLGGVELPAIRYSDGSDRPSLDPDWQWAALVPLDESMSLATVAGYTTWFGLCRWNDSKETLAAWDEQRRTKGGSLMEYHYRLTETEALDQIRQWMRAS